MAATKCPLRLAEEAGIGPLDMVASGFTNGVLPYSGGVMEQPAALIEAVNIYLNEKAKAADG